LLSHLNENADKSLILLCYPAGSGKTTLVRDFLDSLAYNKQTLPSAQNDMKYGWVNGNDDIRNCFDFVSAVVLALQRTTTRSNFPFAKEEYDKTLQVIESLKQSEHPLNEIVTSAVGTFVNDFCAAYSDDVFLVIDDFQNIPDESGWLNPTVDFLFQNIPANLHVIICSREEPKFNLSYLKAKGKMFQLGANEINFTDDETEELLEKVYSLEYSDEEVAALQKTLNGWATGIHLAAQTGKFAETGLRPVSAGGHWKIFDYFADEIFEKLNEEMRTFPLRTALLESFDEQLCDEVLDVENSKKVIAVLISKNVFIETSPLPLSEREGKHLRQYRYHSLFKEFLRSKLSEDKTRESVKRICDYFLKSNDYISAINYLLIGKQFERAVKMIVEIGVKLLEENSYENLAKWLSLIPEDIISSNPYLLYFKARLGKYFIRDLPLSIELYSRAITQAKDRRLLFECQISQAMALSALGKIVEALSILKPLVETGLRPVSTVQKLKLLHSLAFTYYRDTQYLESVKLLDEMFELSKSEKVEYMPEQSLNLMGLNYYGMGEFTKAELYFERVIDAAGDIFLKFRAITFLETLYSNSGKYNRARKLLDRAKAMGEFRGTFLQLHLLMAELNLYFDIGDYENAIQICGKIIALCDKLGYADSKKYANLFMAKAYYYLNDLNLAGKYFDEGSKYLVKDDPWSINFDVWRTVLGKRRERSATSLGDGSQTRLYENILLNQYKLSESRNYFLDKCEIAFHLTDLCLKNDMTEPAQEYLEESLKIAEEKQYISFLERELLDSRVAFDFALGKNIYKDFVKSIFRNVFNKLEYDFLSDECRERITGQIDKLYDIRMKSQQFVVRGMPIPEEKWVRKKGKELLAYLLKNSGAAINKDKIIDTFLPELSPESADAVFHNIISDLRKVLTPPEPYALPPITYQHKELRLNPDCFFKVE
jgi:tetratricopeptide (TPR) repeat protein